jgi:sec-independent protein translocase protein TatA
MIFAPQDVALIAVVGFILFGPKKLPEMAKSLGSSIVEFKKAMKGDEAAKEGEAAKEEGAQPKPETAGAVPAPPQQLALPAQSQDAGRQA